MKAGLEIHQQLDPGNQLGVTGRKLFCRCPCVLREESPDVVVRRFLRPVASELGERDIISEAEASKKKTFVYEAYSDSTCLVEIDEEPPKSLDSDALETALIISRSLNCKILPEINTMRKAIIDGSCPSGFQRTALVARDGFVEVSGKRIRIESVCIEEDAGRMIASGDNSATFRLDRLGIPLVEITTAPDISSPEEAKEVAGRIGLLLRMTGRVGRGLGTIRQDINISADGGARVELKGVQNLGEIPLIVEREIARQEALVRMGEKYWRTLSRASEGKVPLSTAELTDCFSGTECKLLKGKRVFGKSFPGIAGMLKEPLDEGRTFGKEVAEKVRVLTKAKGFIHTDEDISKYGISQEEISKAKKALLAGENDLVFIVTGESSFDFEGPLNVIEERIFSAGKGVPGETRKVNPDNSSSFLRPISGSARFYPETDISPVGTSDLLGKLPEIETPEDRLSMLRNLGLSENLAKKVLVSEKYWVFRKAIDMGVPPVLSATIVEETIPYLERKGVLEFSKIPEGALNIFLKQTGEGKILRELIPSALEAIGKGEGFATQLSGAPGAESVSAEIEKLVKNKSDYIRKEGLSRAMSGLMGLAMEKFKGQVAGAELKSLIELHAKKMAD